MVACSEGPPLAGFRVIALADCCNHHQSYWCERSPSATMHRWTLPWPLGAPQTRLRPLQRPASRSEVAAGAAGSAKAAEAPLWTGLA